MKVLQWITSLVGHIIGKWKQVNKTFLLTIYLLYLRHTISLKNIFLLLFISLLILPLYSQKEASIWYFGKNAGMNFNNTPPIALNNGSLNTLESSGTISDSFGNLLFYTDGKTVWARDHSIMSNGTGLEGSDDASQSGLIVNHPENDSIYYIFTTPYSFDYLDGMKYSIVNINSNNGLGEVIEKNTLLHPNSSEKASAVFHANGKDVWIIGHEWGNNNFFSYLLTKHGINKCPIINSIGYQYVSSQYSSGIASNQGFLKFSPNLDFLAHVFTPNDPFNMYSELYKINRFNSKLSFLTNIPLTMIPW